MHFAGWPFLDGREPGKTYGSPTGIYLYLVENQWKEDDKKKVSIAPVTEPVVVRDSLMLAGLS